MADRLTRIRRSRPDEIERLFEIWRDSTDATHGFVSREDLTAIARIVREDYLPAAELWVIVDADDRALGFMGMTGSSVDSLFIDPAHHGRGLGRAMIDHARAISPDLTVEVNEQNPGAAAFYRAMGFTQVGRSPLDDQGRPYPLLHLRLDA